MALPQSTQQRIASLLANGVQHSIVAGACGITPGYLTQLIENDSELKELVHAAKSKHVERILARDRQYDAIETAILDELPGLVESCTSLGEGVRALAMLQDMKTKRQAGIMQPGQGQDGIGAGVQLHLSDIAAAKVQVTLNGKRAIIEIGGQDVRPMDRSVLEGFLQNDDQAETADPEIEELDF